MHVSQTTCQTTGWWVQASAERLQAVLGDDLVASLKDIKQLTPTEQAQVHTALMQVALTATAFLHRAQGNAGPPAALTAEHRQLKAYETKLQKVLANEDLKAQRKKMEINIDAAHRFIEHAIPELTRQQKTSLKQVWAPCLPLPFHCILQHKASQAAVASNILGALSGLDNCSMRISRGAKHGKT